MQKTLVTIVIILTSCTILKAEDTIVIKTSSPVVAYHTAAATLEVSPKARIKVIRLPLEPAKAVDYLNKEEVAKAVENSRRYMEAVRAIAKADKANRPDSYVRYADNPDPDKLILYMEIQYEIRGEKYKPGAPLSERLLAIGWAQVQSLGVEIVPGEEMPYAKWE